jgi:zinc protease
MLIRSVPPNLSFDSSIKKLAYNTSKLSNKIPIYSIEDKTQSVCGIEIVFSGGKIDESVKGASYFATNMFKSGTKDFSSNDINKFFELKGAFVQMQSGLDFNSVSLYCLSDKLIQTLPFFLKIFNEPLFPQHQLTKLIKKKEQEININNQKSNYWASKLLKESLFKNHPYGHVLSINELDSITTDSLKSHWTKLCFNGVKFITAVGKFSIAQIIDELESSFNGNNKDIVKANNIGVSNHSSFSRKKLENNEQSSLKIGIHSTNLSSSNYAGLSFGTTVLGGYFGSRLMQSIREDRGLTYGINSTIIHLANSSYIQISADLKMGTGDEVLDLIKSEIHKLKNTSIGKNELDKVKNYVIGEFKSNSETIFEKISKVKFLKLNKLEDTYYIDHFKSITQLSSYQIQKSMKENMNTKSFNVVLVE